MHDAQLGAAIIRRTSLAHRSCGPACNRFAYHFFKSRVQHVQECLVGALGLDALAFDAFGNRQTIEHRLHQRGQPFEVGALDDIARGVQCLVDDLASVLLKRCARRFNSGSRRAALQTSMFKPVAV